MNQDQVKQLLEALSIRQRWTIVLTALLAVAAVLGFSKWQQESGFRPLYTGLAPEDASAVVQKLKEENVPYRLSGDSTTVSVPQERVAEIRLEMAGAGLPKSGRIGFEIFDKTNFGMTDFAEHVNFRRAVEGELERSVMAISQVEQARVHISFPQESVFTESRQPAKASVLIKVRAGVSLPESAIPAITNLVSSAVEDLNPEAVSVMDMRGVLLNKPKRRSDREEDTSEAALEYQKKIEQNLAAKLDSTLEPLVGDGKFRVAVSALCDMTSGEQSEETFDPARSVLTSSQKTEDSSSSTRVAGGVPGTASNLPESTPRPVTTGGGISRSTESNTYQSSRMVKRLTLPQGSIRRLSVSVLLDQEVHYEGSGDEAKRVMTAPSPERMKVIHDLAAAAIGFDMERGDQLIVESLPFESTINLETQVNGVPALISGGRSKNKQKQQPQVDKPWYQQLTEALKVKKNQAIAGGVAGGIILAIVGFFMMRKLRKKKAPAEATVSETAALPAAVKSKKQAAVASAEDETPRAVTSPVGAVASIAAPETETAVVQIEKIRDTVMQEAEVSVGVLRGWLREGQA